MFMDNLNHLQQLPMSRWRKSCQPLPPRMRTPSPHGHYDIYPGFPLPTGKLEVGFSALADRLSHHKQVVIDGFGGVFWENLRISLDATFAARGVRIAWIDIAQAFLPPDAIEQRILPFLGGADPLFGTRFTGKLVDFFDPNRLTSLSPDPAADISVLYGCGAALAGWDGLLVYVELPKHEIQYRARAGSICNLGMSQPNDPRHMYKRFYFVDWVALNDHKAGLLPKLDLIIDEQSPLEPIFTTGESLRDGLTAMSQNFVRPRPWFEPGPWGGQWIKAHIPTLPQDEVNYAWSFELIAPENSIAFTQHGLALEVSFDCLMFHAHQAVLGDAAARFGYEFPIRFDLLDTVEGGNLSLQCHPQPDYISTHFGESYTQDETYYILDCTADARVFLGFREGIDPDQLRTALEESFARGTAVDVDRFIHTVPAQKHDLYLIPHGTVHCSGVGNLVLEISATPYIFTFKMYDWLRLDLDGRRRPLNIGRAFENLDFAHQGKNVQALVAQPTLSKRGPDWQQIHLPTHPDHFYNVQRYEFASSITISTDNICHIMNLVEGQSIRLETANGMVQRFNFAETFVVPAAAGSYRLINEGRKTAKVVQAFVRPRTPVV